MVYSRIDELECNRNTATAAFVRYDPLHSR
jgi:hypothetical protein